MKCPRLLLVATMAGTIVIASGMTRLWYDHNLLNMQADGLESVELERKLLAESEPERVVRASRSPTAAKSC